MGVVLCAGEKVFYDRNYGKGRRRSKGNITLTDRRLIRTVESKTGMSKVEIPVEDISGVRMRFKPVLVLIFVLAAIYALVAGALGIMSNMARMEDSLNQAGVGFTANDMFMIWMIVFAVTAVINFIVGLINLRSGLYIVVKTKVSGCVPFISVSDSLGTVKPLRLKPGRSEAYEIFDAMSAAIMQVKSLNV